MKKLFYTVLFIITLTACGGGGSSSISLVQQEGITKLKDVVLEQFGPETEVFALDIDAKDHLETALGSIRIRYVKNNVMYYKDYSSYTGDFVLEEEKQSNIQTKFSLSQSQGKVKLKDFDFNQIHTKFNEAIAMIPDEFESFTLYEWDFNVNNDNEISSSFSVECTKKGEGNSIQGRNIVTNYYQFEFEVDKDGKLSVDE